MENGENGPGSQQPKGQFPEKQCHSGQLETQLSHL